MSSTSKRARGKGKSPQRQRKQRCNDDHHNGGGNVSPSATNDAGPSFVTIFSEPGCLEHLLGYVFSDRSDINSGKYMIDDEIEDDDDDDDNDNDYINDHFEIHNDDIYVIFGGKNEKATMLKICKSLRAAILGLEHKYSITYILLLLLLGFIFDS
eukprot:TRINITY_DN3323_c2_g1_i1.p1 TRINITY_DN3323_c2_g1~~TRINITY_DN3323_c2_g1_i1.p1  ORF type:complete len:155 (+),score=29.05 TRINITY_DN3323_c2_g1_i1:19-483(+)